MTAFDSGSTGRRKIAGRVGFVVYVLGVCALLGYALIPATKSESPDWVPTQTHTDERIELQADYPSNWHLQSFNTIIGHGDHVGFVISNVQHDFEHPELGLNVETQSWDLGTLPDFAVVIEVSLNARFSYLPCRRGIDELRLDLSTFRRTRDRPSYGAPPRLWAGACSEGGYLFATHVWLFPNATTGDREAAETIVESIDQLT